VKSTIYQILSIAAIGLYLLPIVIVIVKKMWSQLPFRLFALYWLISALINGIEHIAIPKAASDLITIIYNILDMPMILGILYVSCHSVKIKKIIQISAPLLLCLELIFCIIWGFRFESLKYTLGAGLVIVLTVIVWAIVLKLQKIKHTGMEKGLLLIYAALLFEYGTYIVIYIFDYFLPGTSSLIDNYIVYYASSLIALTLANCGFLTRGVKVSAPASAIDRYEGPLAKVVG
jgi:hypothetical protein